MDGLKNLDVWRKSTRLCIDVYRAFAPCCDWTIRNQISRAALSVPSNIAEGYERQSHKELIRFLYIAKGSCGELWTQLLISVELGTIEAETGHDLAQRAEELSKMLYGLIQYYRDSKVLVTRSS